MTGVQTCALPIAYSGDKADQQLIYKSKVLPFGDYTLTMTCETGDYLIIDAFRVNSVSTKNDAFVVEPIIVTSGGVRVTELSSDKKIDVSVPVINNGNKELKVTVAYAISGNEGAL